MIFNTEIRNNFFFSMNMWSSNLMWLNKFIITDRRIISQHFVVIYSFNILSAVLDSEGNVYSLNLQFKTNRRWVGRCYNIVVKQFPFKLQGARRMPVI